jgi:hypothetical protein
VSLPADESYADPSYVVSHRGAFPAGWSRTALHAMSRRGLSVQGERYAARLADRVDLGGLDFGGTCVARARGGVERTFWTTDKAAAVLRGNEPAWRTLVNTTLHLTTPEGSRLKLAETFAEAHGQFLGWLKAGDASPLHVLSMELASLAMNTAFGQQDGQAAVEDPVVGDWVVLSGLTARVSAAIAVSADARTVSDAVRAYTGLLRQLSRNQATVTPSSPAGCGQ